MKRVAVSIVLIASVMTAQLHGQVAAAPADSSKPPKKREKAVAEKGHKSSGDKLSAPAAAGLQSNEPTTTEIYADEAFFDSAKNMGIFSGRVKVTDPRFSLQSDKLTVFISEGAKSGSGEGRRRRRRWAGARPPRSEWRKTDARCWPSR